MAERDWTESFFDRSYVDLLEVQKDPTTTKKEVDFVLEALELEPPARILDVACGFGRHGIELARRGFEVVGVDNSPHMLARARHRTGRTPRIRFERRDMRRLSFAGEFDAVINMFTSFGYFSDSDNRSALKSMAKALRAGGRILIETIDRRSMERLLARNSSNRIWWPVSDDRYILEEIRFDSARGVLHSEWLILRRAGQRFAMSPKRIRLRLYDGKEWREMFDSAGLRRLAIHRGQGRGQDEKMASARQVIVGQRRIRDRVPRPEVSDSRSGP